MRPRAITPFAALAALAALAPVLLPLPAAGQGGTIHGVIAVPSQGIRDVVVYLVPTAAVAVPAVRPETVAMDQRALHFVPRVVAVTPGSTVLFSNSDRVMHNVFHPMQSSERFDLGLWAPGESRTFTFGQEGAYVILCQVHPEMVGYVVVVASPYRAVADDHGRFRLEHVAPGTYRLRTWHRRLQEHEESVTVTESGTTRVEMSLRSGNAVKPAAKP